MKIIGVVTMILFSSALVSAQNQIETSSATKLNQKSNSVIRSAEKTQAHPARGAKFSTASKPSKNVSTLVKVDDSILQELNSIQDERNRIEKNTTLSSGERTRQIQENNIRYQSKKTEFIEYISNSGVLNVSKTEQSYYLSFLKNDNNIEKYLTTKELIKTAK